MKPVLKRARGSPFYLTLREQEKPRRLGNPTCDELGSGLTVLCWNMGKARRRGWLEDLSACATGVDLVLLQEAVLHDGEPHPFHLSSGFEWIMAENLGHIRHDITTGPKTGSRCPAASSRAVRSPDLEAWGTPKTMLLTHYPYKCDNTSESLLVLNVHAINFVSIRKFGRQVEQMMAAVAGHKGPCLVAGDFNTWNRARRHLVTTAMAMMGLAHAHIVIPPRLSHLNQTLDHVFYRGLRLLSAKPLVHVKSSDHVPLRVEFGVEA